MGITTIIKTLICAAALAVASPSFSSEPIGIANNNPGNIVQSDINWKGKVSCDSRFECFDTPENGIRALGMNLLAYYFKRDLTTLASILRVWSPPHENDTENIIVAFGARHGFYPDIAIDVWDYSVFRRLVVGIIIQENGYNPYGDRVDAGLFSITAYGMSAHWKNNDTIRTRYYARVDPDRGSDAANLEEARPRSTEVSSNTGQGGDSTEGILSSTNGSYPADGMDPAGNRLDRYLFGYPIAEVGSDIHGYHSRGRVDRNDFWFLVLYGWHRGAQVVRCTWLSNYAIRYTLDERNRWALLWWFYSKWKTLTWRITKTISSISSKSMRLWQLFWHLRKMRIAIHFSS